MNWSRAFLFVPILVTLISCGGGGGNSNSGNSLSGVAASGAAISGTIYLKDSAGHELSTGTADGTYSFPLSGLTSPFMLKAQWTANNQAQTLYSFATKSGTANITPLTQLIVVAAAKTSSLDAVYATPTLNFVSIAAALPGAIVDVQKTLNPLLTSFGQNNADLISGVFVPNHTGMDALLDKVLVSTTATDVIVTNKLNGSLILQAPARNITYGSAVPDWSSINADVAYDLDVAVNNSGVGLAAWSENVNGHFIIRTRFLDGTGTQPVNISVAGDSSLPHIAVDGADNVLLVWAQYQNGTGTVWGSRYTASTKKWSVPTQISTIPSLGISYPTIGVDHAGNAIMTWVQFVANNHFDAWSVRFDASQSSWSAPMMISNGTNSVHDCRVVINASGKGLVLLQMEQGDGTTVSNAPIDVYARSVTTAGIWGNQTRINAVLGSNTNWIDGYPAIAIDTNGNGVALFVQNTAASLAAVQASMYTPSGGWQASAPITNSTTSGFRFPQVAFDGSGNAFAVWQEQPLTGGAIGSASRYQVSSGWGNTLQLADNSQGDIEDPHLAVDGQGNATVIWYQFSMTSTSASTTVNSIRYSNSTGWGPRNLVSLTSEMDGVMTIPVPRVASNAQGQTVMIWGVFTM